MKWKGEIITSEMEKTRLSLFRGQYDCLERTTVILGNLVTVAMRRTHIEKSIVFLCGSNNHFENLTEKSPETSEPAAISQLALPPILLASPLCCGHRPRWAGLPEMMEHRWRDGTEKGCPGASRKGACLTWESPGKKDFPCVHELDGWHGGS